MPPPGCSGGNWLGFGGKCTFGQSSVACGKAEPQFKICEGRAQAKEVARLAKKAVTKTAAVTKKVVVDPVKNRVVDPIKENRENKLEGRENERENKIKIETSLQAADTCYAKFQEIVEREPGIMLNTDFGAWKKELERELKCIQTEHNKMKEIEKQAKAASGYIMNRDGYADEIEPAVVHVNTLLLDAQDYLQIRLPGLITFDKYEPLYVRDDMVDIYKAQMKFEADCAQGFKDLATMTEELEGTELSSEGRRKLAAVAACPLKSTLAKEDQTIPANAAEFIEKAKSMNISPSVQPPATADPDTGALQSTGGNQTMLILGVFAMLVLVFALK